MNKLSIGVGIFNLLVGFYCLKVSKEYNWNTLNMGFGILNLLLGIINIGLGFK